MTHYKMCIYSKLQNMYDLSRIISRQITSQTGQFITHVYDKQQLDERKTTLGDRRRRKPAEQTREKAQRDEKQQRPRKNGAPGRTTGAAADVKKLNSPVMKMSGETMAVRFLAPT